MDTKTLRDILEKNKSLTRVELPKAKDCTAFWSELTNDVYHILPMDEKEEDKRVGDSMQTFSEKDSLEVVNKQGRLLKRFAKHYKEEHGIKLSDSVLGVIGDKLQYHLSIEVNQYWIDFTNSIDWNDGEFGKGGSCWFGAYSDSVPTWNEGGGWAIRFYDDENQVNHNGIGRTWILPKDGVLMCFNSYGIERPMVSKVIKSVFARDGIELHYKAIEVQNSQHKEVPYINSGTGFILYTEGTELQDSYDVDMEVIEIEDEDSIDCEGCGGRMSRDDSFYFNDCDWCESCYHNRFSVCDKCGESFDNDEVHKINGCRYDYVCEDCAVKLGAELCQECGDYDVNYIATDEGNTFCEDCNESIYCESCDEFHESGCDNEEGEEESTETTENTVVYDERDNITCELETVSYRTSEGTQTNTLMVYRHVNIAGLYMIKDERGFSITHETSGLGVKTSIVESYKAFMLFNRLEGLTDWTQSRESIMQDFEIRSKIMNLREEITG